MLQITKMNFGKLFAQQVSNRAEKSLRHVAMVAKTLDDNKPKTSLKEWIRTLTNFIGLIQFHLIFQMLAKFYKVVSERTVSKFTKIICMTIAFLPFS